jgi:Tfp pilus assembly protein PilF
LWVLIEKLQKENYGSRNPVLINTWKNMGICYLGVGASEQARKYFEQCIELLEHLKSETDVQK